MIALLCFLLTLCASPFKSKSRLEAENVALRRQLIILRRKVRGRAHLTDGDRFFFVQLYRWLPSVLNTITIIRPETLVRWHRAGFRRYWGWKSRSLGGRPQIDADLRALIRRIGLDNPLWGAPRIHGELLKLGFEVTQSASTLACATSCSTAKSSTLCARPKSSSRVGGGTTTRSGRTHRSDTSRQHRRYLSLPSPRGRLRYANRLRRPR
jgi:hypothetical protein